MSQLTALGFNLWLNAGCSFVAGLLIVFLSLRLFRVPDGRAKLTLLMLPFAKICVDLFRGVPDNSALLAGLDPLSLPPRHQTLTLGAGWTELGPSFSLVFSARDLAGQVYSTSFADYLFAFLTRHVAPAAPSLVLGGVLAISLWKAGQRIWSWARFERNRANDASHERIRELQAGWRKVTIYLSDRFRGSPFTGGLYAPYVCFPRASWQLLSPPEREAAIAHELAHVRHHDLLGNLAVQILGDLFWFVPGYQRLSLKIDRLREKLADRHAVRAGASAAHLASSLLKLQGVVPLQPEAGLLSALVREHSLLQSRVSWLIGKTHSKPPRLGWNHPALRPLWIAWTAGGVVLTTFGGNPSILRTPDWLGSLLRLFGLA